MCSSRTERDFLPRAPSPEAELLGCHGVRPREGSRCTRLGSPCSQSARLGAEGRGPSGRVARGAGPSSLAGAVCVQTEKPALKVSSDAGAASPDLGVSPSSPLTPAVFLDHGPPLGCAGCGHRPLPVASCF